MRVIKGQYIDFSESQNPNGDTNVLWIGPDQEPTHYIECEFARKPVAETIKITRGARGHRFTRCSIPGGFEDCVDMLGCSDIVFEFCSFSILNARTLATIKGGARGIEFHRCAAVGRPRHHAYFDLGGHTIYREERMKTSEVVIDQFVAHTQHRVLSLARTWNADSPAIFDSEGTWILGNLSIPKPVWELYFALRDKGIL
jgi:hypothetical protein